VLRRLPEVNHMTRALSLVALILTLSGAVACDDECKSTDPCARDLPPGPSPIPTDPTPVTLNTFEFRVLGTAQRAVDIRYSTSQEGTSILSSQVPWATTVRTTDSASFLALTAHADVRDDFEDTILQVQIIVNGRLFREASESSLSPTVSVCALCGPP